MKFFPFDIHRLFLRWDLGSKSLEPLKPRILESSTNTLAHFLYQDLETYNYRPVKNIAREHAF